jgi:hypothetical protein
MAQNWSEVKQNGRTKGTANAITLLNIKDAPSISIFIRAKPEKDVAQARTGVRTGMQQGR